MVTLTGLIVLAVPNFANLMALVGATCCTMIAFVLPAIFHLKIFKGYVYSIHRSEHMYLSTQWKHYVHARLYLFQSSF